jgi:hypothetical protein
MIILKAFLAFIFISSEGIGKVSGCRLPVAGSFHRQLETGCSQSSDGASFYQIWHSKSTTYIETYHYATIFGP